MRLSRRRGTGTTKRIWLLAWPAILSFFAMSVQAISFIKIAATIGPDAVAVVSSGVRIWMLLQALQMALAVAATALVARAWGAGDRAHAGGVAVNGVVGAVVLGAVTGLPVIFFARPIAEAFGLPETVTTTLVQFIVWSGIFNATNSLRFVMEASLRATGDVRTPMLFTFLVTGIGIVIGVLFSHGAGDWDGLGVQGLVIGSGVATIICYFSLLVIWLRGKRPLRPNKSCLRDIRVWRTFWVVGWPTALEQAVLQVSIMAYVIILARFGTAVFAAYGISTMLMFLPITIGIGFSSAAATLVGQRMGAGDVSGAKRAGARALVLAFGCMSITGILTWIFADSLAALMIADPVVQAWVAKFLILIAVMQPLIAIDFALSGSLRGAGDTRYPMSVTLFSQLLARLGMGYVLAELGFSPTFIAAAMIADYSLKSVLLIWRFFGTDRWQTAMNARVA
jgi:Na+-driven multidrug efflux pump